MNPTPQVAPEKFVETMKDEIEQYAKDVMEAVNKAPDGAWIAGSEERVRDLSAEMRRKVFERALQQRVDAAEAAFSPSAPSGALLTASITSLAYRSISSFIVSTNFSGATCVVGFMPCSLLGFLI